MIKFIGRTLFKFNLFVMRTTLYKIIWFAVYAMSPYVLNFVNVHFRTGANTYTFKEIFSYEIFWAISVAIITFAHTIILNTVFKKYKSKIEDEMKKLGKRTQRILKYEAMCFLIPIIEIFVNEGSVVLYGRAQNFFLILLDCFILIPCFWNMFIVLMGFVVVSEKEFEFQCEEYFYKKTDIEILSTPEERRARYQSYLIDKLAHIKCPETQKYVKDLKKSAGLVLAGFATIYLLFTLSMVLNKDRNFVGEFFLEFGTNITNLEYLNTFLKPENLIYLVYFILSIVVGLVYYKLIIQEYVDFLKTKFSAFDSHSQEDLEKIYISNSKNGTCRLASPLYYITTGFLSIISIAVEVFKALLLKKIDD
ncbi:hypothetical protein FACS1894132_06970 [Clostridia bacterium]|nr:hypothetical protein FACS1894132_06970 [Clostridia bacterium]